MRKFGSVLFALGLVACAPQAPAANVEPGPAQNGAPIEVGPANGKGQAPAFAGQTRAPERKSGVRLETKVLARGFNRPFALAFLPDGAIILTEKKAGALRLVSVDGVVGPPIEGVPAVDLRSQGGLLDVAVSPSFATDGLIYLTYAEPRDGGTNGVAVMRARLGADRARLEAQTVIFRQKPDVDSGGHFGSRIAFAPDGSLFVGLGERQKSEPRKMAQDPTTHIGKVVRINSDGSAPAGNPYRDGIGGAPEVWSSGHRNVQGADIDPKTGALWTLEHGPRGGDELNRPEAGKNYGWPIITYGVDYSGAPIGDGITAKDGMEQPVYYWDPVISPGGIAFYDGAMFPEWRGDLLIGAMEPAGLVRLEFEGGRVSGEERFDVNIGRVRDIAIALDGSIYAVTDESDGALVRISRAAS